MNGRGWGKPLRGEESGLSHGKHAILLHFRLLRHARATA